MRIRLLSLTALVGSLLTPSTPANAGWLNRAPTFDKYMCEYATDIIRLHCADPAQVGPGIRAAIADIWGSETVKQCPFVPQSVAEASAPAYSHAIQSRFGLSWDKVLEIIRRGRGAPDPAPEPPMWFHDCPITAQEAFGAGTTVGDLCAVRREADQKKAQAARIKAQAEHGCSPENTDPCRAAFPKAFATCVNYGNSGQPQPWAKYRDGDKLRQGREAHCAKALAGPALCGWDPTACPGAPSQAPSWRR